MLLGEVEFDAIGVVSVDDGVKVEAHARFALLFFFLLGRMKSLNAGKRLRRALTTARAHSAAAMPTAMPANTSVG